MDEDVAAFRNDQGPARACYVECWQVCACVCVLEVGEDVAVFRNDQGPARACYVECWRVCACVCVFWKWVRISLLSGMTRDLRVRVVLSVAKCVRVCVLEVGEDITTFRTNQEPARACYV